MIQTNKNKNILRTDVGGGYSPITKTYQDIANKIGTTSNAKASNSDNTLQIYKDIASQMPSPNTSVNENSDVVKAYQESANRLLSEKEVLDPNDKNHRIEEDTYNSKIESTNELIKAYMQNSKNSISAKANAELAQQNAVNGTAAYLKAAGLSGQGIAESTIADVNKNYANAMAGIEAQENENNSNAQNSYLEALKQANSERQSRLDAKESAEEEREYQKSLIEDQRAYDEKKENQGIYYEMLNTDYSSILSFDDKGNIISVDENALENYKNLAEQYHSEDKISDVQYDSAIKLYQEALKEEEKRLDKAVSDGGIIASKATEADFGNYFDSGKVGSKQSTYVNAIIKAAKEGKIPDGTIINFNYGMGVINNFEYRNGVWYTAPRQPNTKTYDERNIENLIGKIDY